MTARHTVKGVARISPAGPHSAVHTTADTMMASGDKPVLAPYSQGSMRLLLTSSSVTTRAKVQPSICQPGSTAKASANGNAAAITGPT